MIRKSDQCFFLVLLCVSLVACSGTLDKEELISNPDLVPDEDRSRCVPTTPPPELGLAPFYTKYCNAQGIGIVASEEVDDLALQQAYYIITNLLKPIPGVRNILTADGHYIAIIGKDQEQTTLPEYAHMDSDYWDNRARGLGAGHGAIVTSSGEENLLCLGLGRDPYFRESILVHEFAHTIHLSGQGTDYKNFNEKLSALYYDAREANLWENTYAMTNPDEYWAEGVQTYFNSNIGIGLPNGVHNSINTREELAEYDPALYAFIADFFNHFSWDPTCPERN